MFAEKSKEMMVRSFRKTRYRFDERPAGVFRENYGIYVHIPFCPTQCAFCPFYHEPYDKHRKDEYVKALLAEIERTDIGGTPAWLYFGGGTPNTFSIDDIGSVISAIRKKASFRSAGMELLPHLLTEEYIAGIAASGITKISIGVESLDDAVLTASNRSLKQRMSLKDIIIGARKAGLWVNVDMMIGLPSQTAESFLRDVEHVCSLKPMQVTIYPYMVISGTRAKPSMSDHMQFSLIEDAARILAENGLARQGIWIFAASDDVYDTSRDELITDYAGFGAGAFSTYGGWKVVSPELAIYMDDIRSGKRRALIAPKTTTSDAWRRFARQMYDIVCKTERTLPTAINMFIRALYVLGYARSGTLTKKGILLAHDITKTVVESLPYPLQNRDMVENYCSYLQEKKQLS